MYTLGNNIVNDAGVFYPGVVVNHLCHWFYKLWLQAKNPVILSVAVFHTQIYHALAHMHTTHQAIFSTGTGSTSQVTYC